MGVAVEDVDVGVRVASGLVVGVADVVKPVERAVSANVSMITVVGRPFASMVISATMVSPRLCTVVSPSPQAATGCASKTYASVVVTSCGITDVTKRAMQRKSVHRWWYRVPAIMVGVLCGGVRMSSAARTRHGACWRLKEPREIDASRKRTF